MGVEVSFCAEAVILYGGQGTRLRPLTHTGPKQHVKVDGKPISQWGFDALWALGVDEFCVVLGDNGAERVVGHYGDGSKWGVRVIYVCQGRAGVLRTPWRRRRLGLQRDASRMILG